MTFPVDDAEKLPVVQFTMPHNWRAMHRTLHVRGVEASDFRRMCPGDSITILLPGGLRAVRVECIPGGWFPRPLRRSGEDATWEVEHLAWGPMPIDSLPFLMFYLEAALGGADQCSS